jgi:hypothetical protein
MMSNVLIFILGIPYPSSEYEVPQNSFNFVVFINGGFEERRHETIECIHSGDFDGEWTITNNRQSDFYDKPSKFPDIQYALIM